MKSKWIIILSWVAILFLPIQNGLAQETSQPVVKAVFFFSPTCGHCQMVINDVLIPMIEDYGDQLQIAAVDVTQQGGGVLFGEVINYLGIPPEEAGVPVLILGDVVLRGSQEIPNQFPSLVSDGLEKGGIDWPSMPPIQASLPPEVTDPDPDSPTADEASEGTPIAASQGSDSNPEGSTLAELTDAATAPPSDPVGFTLAGLILVGMVGSLGYSLLKFGSSEPLPAQKDLNTRQKNDYAKSGFYSAGVPILCVLGLVVAGYLAYVEVSQVAPVCGPIGECGLVQASPYARLFGFVPVAILGLLFFLSILGVYIAIELGALRSSRAIIVGLISITFLGTLFSIYLTVVEIFLIKAVCMWCLSSAVITTTLLVILANQNRILIQPD